jgi:inosine/xanthosine triphosphatase
MVISENPAKIIAVKNSLLKFHNLDEFEISSCPVESGVSSLPQNDNESILGCKNRIKYTLDNYKDISLIDYIVGIEGGLDIRDKNVFINTWVVIYNLKSKKYSFGCSPKISLPNFIIESTKNDISLQNTLSEIANCDDVHRKNGTIGILTKDLLTRSESTNLAFLCAYCVFVHSDIYSR